MKYLIFKISLLTGVFLINTQLAFSQSPYPFGWPLDSQQSIESQGFQTTLFLQGLNNGDNPHLIIGTDTRNQTSLGIVQNQSFSADIPSNSGFLTIGQDFGIYNFYKDGQPKVMSFGSFAGYGQVNVNGNFSSGPININKAPGGAATFNEEGEIKYENGDFHGFTSNGWQSFTAGMPTGGTSSWLENGSDIYYDLGNVGVGLTTPQSELHVKSQDALANLFVESSSGTNIRMFSFTGSAGIGTTTNTPLSLAAFNTGVMNLYPDKNVEIFGDLLLEPDNEIKFGNSGHIRSDNNGLSIYDISTVDIEGTNVNMFTCGGSIDISADCEGFLNLFGGFQTSLFGFFETSIGSSSLINFEIDNENLGFINGNSWRANAGFTIEQQGLTGSQLDGLTFQNDGSGDDYWNMNIGFNDLTFSYDADGPGAADSFIAKARVDDEDGSWDQISDIRVKENISPLKDVLPKLMQLEPSRYRYINAKAGSGESIGFIAQEVQQLFPEFVNDEGEYLAVSYGEMSVIAIKAIKEQQVVIDLLLQRQQSLLDRIEDLESK